MTGHAECFKTTVERAIRRAAGTGEAMRDKPFTGDSVTPGEYLAMSQYGGKYNTGCDAYNGMRD
ncbi:hypothetical protein SAMN05192564_105111 [Paraburkholderia sartisoli]|uniref:Uncharacterized protein n=1 Tax=Paraburkholderia sartisoli TaxID=83784 RepID=A0A1H4FVZ5_9BURK|nr:hypothetical protein SAMN05192564_105111 [Paraburkholderia sartisoli]